MLRESSHQGIGGGIGTYIFESFASQSSTRFSHEDQKTSPLAFSKGQSGEGESNYFETRKIIVSINQACLQEIYYFARA